MYEQRYARLNAHNTTWARLYFGGMQARGKLQPRLIVHCYADAPQEGTRAQIIHLNATLSMGREGETLSYGSTTSYGLRFRTERLPLDFEFPLTREVSEYMQAHFREHAEHFHLHFEGLLRVRDDRPLSEEDQQQLADWDERLYGARPLTRGEWYFLPISRDTSDYRNGNLSVEVHRGTWNDRVLRPLGYGEHIVLDIPIPKAPDESLYQKALGHLREAQTRYERGDDPGVFSSCRAVFESIVQDPRRILEQVEDDDKRQKVDELLKQANAYFHAGRHVSKSGPQQGEFAVDHRDAEFALGMAKMFFGYTAKLLTRSNP